MIERKFGRLKSFDERSRNFSIRRFTRGLEPKTVYWKCGTVLDQGSQPACVGFSWAGELAAEPVPVPNMNYDYGMKLYHGAQKNDEWDGEDYEGSSVLGGWRYCRSLGWYDEVSWAFSMEDWILGLQTGPAVIGITWKSDMMSPDSNNFITFTGYSEGGHAILLNGYNLEEHYFTFHNSWGKDWARNGEVFIREDDMNKARQDAAECAIITGRHFTETPEPDPDPDDDDDDGFCSNIGAMIMRLAGRRW